MSPSAARWARRQAQPDFAWVVIDETSGVDPTGPPFADQPAQPAPSRRLRWAALWLFPALLLIAAAVLLWLRAEAGLAQMTREVATAVQGAALLGQARPGSHQAKVGVTRVAFHPGAAMAEVVITQTTAAGQVVVRRQMSFFTQTAHGWQHSRPSAAFWGEQETLDTPSLHFVYRRLDREAVAQVAPTAERLYRSLHELVGLPNPTGNPPLTIEVVPQIEKPGLRPRTGSLRLPSPYLVFALPGQSWADVLHTMLRQALVRHVLEAALAESPPKAEWNLMVAALQSWLLVKADGGASDPAQHAGVPLLGESRPVVRLPLAAFLSCAACTTTHPGGGGLGYQPVMQSELGSWLIDYLVARYGVEIIPRLLHAFSRYEDWETLAPAVLGESAAAVEAGWQQ